jgi:hypothetical protein
MGCYERRKTLDEGRSISRALQESRELVVPVRFYSMI